MTLPQVSTQVELPHGFHRGATIGSIGNAIAAAGTKQRKPVKYKTTVKRVIRMAMASWMFHRDITSFNQLGDLELQGMLVAVNRDVVGVAQWLDGQNFPSAPLPPQDLYDDMREEGPLDGDRWGDNAY